MQNICASLFQIQIPDTVAATEYTDGIAQLESANTEQKLACVTEP